MKRHRRFFSTTMCLIEKSPFYFVIGLSLFYVARSCYDRFWQKIWQRLKFEDIRSTHACTASDNRCHVISLGLIFCLSEGRYHVGEKIFSNVTQKVTVQFVWLPSSKSLYLYFSHFPLPAEANVRIDRLVALLRNTECSSYAYKLQRYGHQAFSR